MLSYRHAFHAGNHADVLKHLVLQELLLYMNQKDKPWWYIDTHAGAGRYDLSTGFATKNAEFQSGIARLWNEPALPAPLARFVEIIKQDNAKGQLQLYPGSPWVAKHWLRLDDKMRLFELHPSDVELLNATFDELHMLGSGRPVLVQHGDGFAGLKAVLPPPTRRAVVLIDPPYEDKQDYQTVVKAMQEAIRRFATGTYAIWYPQLQRPGWQQMVDKLKQLPVKGWINVSLQVDTPREDGFGMYGSGMFIVNPPYTLEATLKDCMPVLKKLLGNDRGADFVLESASS
ncbi:23S rRNA (adenine(2030)-N(6))-methyltransferase RlmJ [Leeia oryzae]|uniref:23S rRNA (adenine(2030)-N(6))-methyltransferase RlmJ n=1 Tax=Leeia oryzae TaxID=356662 RepID=UPI000372F2D5|nr:23S rRNA (adenine(2030)-N(6))-methyltransferase RlmJ [Leeia oryzae]